MKTPCYPFMVSRTSTVLVIYVTFLLAIISMIILSGCGMVVSTKTAMITPVVSPTLMLLSQAGNLESYQTDGTRNWQISASSAYNTIAQARTHLISDDHMLYTATDRLQASTFSGNVRWQHSLSAPADDLLQVQQHLYVLSGSTVGELSAWQSAQGELLWVHQGASLPFGPWTALKNDGTLLFLGGENYIIALDANTGKIIWQDDLDPGDGAEQLVVARDILLVQTGTKILALQGTSGTVLWQRERYIQAWYVDPAEMVVYTASIDVPDPVTQPNAPTWSGFRASDLATGKQLWAVAQPLSVMEEVGISANGILLSDAASLSAWDLQGKQRWHYMYAGSPIVHVEVLLQTETDLIFTQDGTVSALHSQDGSQRWQQTLIPRQDYQVTISQNQYWMMDKDDGDIVAFSLQGAKQWSLKLPPFADITIQR
jgi:outer membrane protein assembly factor BamB